MKKLVIVVDMQNDFITGVLGFEGALKVKSQLIEYLQSLDDSVEVVFTQDTHFDNYLETEEGRHLPIPHCIQHTHGWQIDADVFKAADGKQLLPIVEKPTFGSLDLGFLIELEEEVASPYDEIVVTGLVTNMCVISAAIVAKAACPNAKISVPWDLTDSFDDELFYKAIKVMESMHMDVTPALQSKEGFQRLEQAKG